MARRVLGNPEMFERFERFECGFKPFQTFSNISKHFQTFPNTLRARNRSNQFPKNENCIIGKGQFDNKRESGSQRDIF